jgi:hypothetical protein
MLFEVTHPGRSLKLFAGGTLEFQPQLQVNTLKGGRCLDSQGWRTMNFGDTKLLLSMNCQLLFIFPKRLSAFKAAFLYTWFYFFMIPPLLPFFQLSQQLTASLRTSSLSVDHCTARRAFSPQASSIIYLFARQQIRLLFSMQQNNFPGETKTKPLGVQSPSGSTNVQSVFAFLLS